MSRPSRIRLLFAAFVGIALSAWAMPTLSQLAPNAELRAELTRYGLKAYAYTDGTNTIKALHYRPKGNAGRKLPMIVYYPGRGEIGEPIRQFRVRCLFELVTGADFQQRHPCHLLALSLPQTTGTLLGGLPDRPTALQRLTHDFIRAFVNHRFFAIDPDRLYATGYSYGGSAAYAVALHYPGEFAAVVPISALPPQLEYFDREHPGNWWHFYNEGDYTRRDIPTDELNSFRDRTLAAGGDFRIGSYPAAGHDAWTRTWREPALWDWVFSKSLNRKAKAATTATAMDLFGAVATATVPGADPASGPERALDGLEETGYRPAVPFTRNDWWMVRFPHPITGRVVIASGDRRGERRLANAFVEVSADGTRWTRAGTFSEKTGRCTFTRNQRFNRIRIRVPGAQQSTFLLRKLSVYPGK